MEKKITQEEFDQHDCHLSPEDSCEVCQRWSEQNEYSEREPDLEPADFSGASDNEGRTIISNGR